MKEITILEELKNLLPPLTETESQGLEVSILKEGVLSPLIVWNDVLVDGHHRYEICKKHEIPYQVKNIILDSLDAAKLWAWKHQENRRNLTAFHRGELALKLKDVIAARAKERQGNRNDLNDDNIPPKSAESKETRQELAQIAGIAPSTLGQVQYIAEHANEETKEKLRRGDKETSINKEYNRLKSEEKNRDKTTKTSSGTSKNSRSTKGSKSGKSRTKTTSENRHEDTKIVSLRKGVKERDTYVCGIRFEPDPDDDHFDWITDEEREELREMQKNCPNRLVPMIRNYTIQSIPEHDPQYLVSCLFSLFSPLYRQKLLFALARKMFAQDDPNKVHEMIETLHEEFNLQ